MSGAQAIFASPATGELSADLRLNYEYGMVLGVDDFRQEQHYFLEKNYLHHRALHGYGTIAGLHVAAESSDSAEPATSDDVTVKVEPGLAIDQLGRGFQVATDQCARLGIWLHDEDQRDTDDSRIHGRIDERLRKGPAGLTELTVYVVAQYDESSEGSMPVGRQSVGDDQQPDMPSRVRDRAAIDFRWTPPRMTAWRLSQGLAPLLANVNGFDEAGRTRLTEDFGRLVRGLDDDDRASLIGYFEQLVEELLAPLSIFSESPFRSVDETLARWVTEIRPHLLGGSIHPTDAKRDPAILLASLKFLAGPPSDSRPVRVELREQPENSHRPLLVNTQLTQGTSMLTRSISVPFVTLTPQREGDHQEVELWFHPDISPTASRVQVRKPAVEILAEPGPDSDLRRVAIAHTTHRRPNVFRSRLQGHADQLPTHLRILIDTDETEIGVTDLGLTTEHRMSLRRYISRSGIRFDGWDGGHRIVAYVHLPRA
jgi:hypothetical protein